MKAPLYIFIKHENNKYSLGLLTTLMLAGWLVSIWTLFPDCSIHLGSIGVPTLDTIFIWFLWSLWGSASALCLGLFLTAISSRCTWPAHWRAMLCVAILSTIASVAIKVFVFHHFPITDDESSYLHLARLISVGRFYEDSPVDRLLFDRTFMINDGRYFAQYPIGWPSLLALGMKLHLTEYLPALLHGLTVIVIYYLTNAIRNPTAGLVAALVYASCPLALINAATFLSHTSATLVILLALYAMHEMVTRKRYYVLAAIMVSVAVFIRPYTAITMLAPCVLAFCGWLLYVNKNVRGLIFFVVAGILGAMAFAYINIYLYGHPLKLGYDAYFTYAKSNGFRFSWWVATIEGLNIIPVVGAPPFELESFIIYFLSGFGRLIYDGMGWTIIVMPILAFGIIRSKVAFLFALSICTTVGGYALWRDMGIDSYGPVHLSEAAALLAIIFAIGLGDGIRWLSVWFRFAAVDTARASLIFGLACALTIILALLPVKLGVISRMVVDIESPFDMLAKQNIHRAIIFSPTPFTLQKSNDPAHHFVFWRPVSSILFNDDILWVNDLGEKIDRELMVHYPGRTAYRLIRDASMADQRLRYVALLHEN